MKTNARSSRIRKIQSTCSSMLLTKTTLCEVQGVCTKLIKLESKNNRCINFFNNVRCVFSSKLGFLIHNNVMAKAKGKIKLPKVKVPKSHVKKTNTTKAMKIKSTKSAPVTSTVFRRNAAALDSVRLATQFRVPPPEPSKEGIVLTTHWGLPTKTRKRSK